MANLNGRASHYSHILSLLETEIIDWRLEKPDIASHDSARAVRRAHDVNRGKSFPARGMCGGSEEGKGARGFPARVRAERQTCLLAFVNFIARIRALVHFLPGNAGSPRSAESASKKRKRKKKEEKRKEISANSLRVSLALNSSPVVVGTFMRLSRQAISLIGEQRRQHGIRSLRRSSETGKPLGKSA